MKSLITAFRVSTSDVDMRKNLRVSAFMAMAQEVANYHASAIGFGYYDLISNNVVWVLSRLRIKYLRSPRWEEEVQLETWHKGREGVFCLRDFDMRDGDGNSTVCATSSWLLIDIKSRRMLRPDHVLGSKATDTALMRDVMDVGCGKIGDPEGLQLVRTRQVMYSDIDFNGHTNNAKYMEWAFDALPLEVITTMDVDECQINFNHETRLGDTVDIYHAAAEEGLHFIEGRSSDKVVFRAEIRMRPQ